MVTIQTTECIEDFQRWLSEPQYSNSVHTVKAYSTDIRMFFHELRVESFQVQDLNRLAAEWLKWSRETRKLKASTISRRKAAVRALANFLEMEGPLLPHYKAPSIGVRKPHCLPRLEQDIEAMLSVTDNHAQQALVACLGYQGMRMHEALELPVSSIDLKAGAIDIIGKGDKERRIPLTRNGSTYIMPQLIQRMCAGETHLFAYQDRTARNTITSLGEKAGIRNVNGTPRPVASHDLRATFATAVYRDTKDIRLVQLLLGHADISTTQIYIGLTFDQMREAIE